MKLFTFLSLIFSLPFMSIAQTKELPQLGKNSIKEVIAAMTLEEKFNLVVGAGMRFGAPQ
jgi:beta-glucosidase